MLYQACACFQAHIHAPCAEQRALCKPPDPVCVSLSWIRPCAEQNAATHSPPAMYVRVDSQVIFSIWYKISTRGAQGSASVCAHKACTCLITQVGEPTPRLCVPAAQLLDLLGARAAQPAAAGALQTSQLTRWFPTYIWTIHCMSAIVLVDMIILLLLVGMSFLASQPFRGRAKCNAKF
jgi:hypothetical protein